MIEKKLPPNLHRDTLAVRAGIEPSQYGENSEALYLTSSFVQPDAETAARRFAGTEEGFTYSRTSNPTVVAFENRLAALEGTEAAIGASSGMGAILMLCMGLLKAGDHVVCSRSVFGSTLNLFGAQFAQVRRGDHVRVADECRPSGAPRCGPTRNCCLPRRPPTR